MILVHLGAIIYETLFYGVDINMQMQGFKKLHTDTCFPRFSTGVDMVMNELRIYCVCNFGGKGLRPVYTQRLPCPFPSKLKHCDRHFDG